MSKNSRQRQHRPTGTVPTPYKPGVEGTPASAMGRFSLLPGVGSIWRRFCDFSGCGTDASYLWTRWLVLRAVGLVYVFVFAGVINDGVALAGPRGVAPVSNYLSYVRDNSTGPLSAFFGAPSLLWISSGEPMMRVLAWAGLAAAIAVILNIGPRLALFACWATFLSFVSTWPLFSAAQLDVLMLEAAFLGIFFAPPGLRPGLGKASPPKPLVLFMMRWFLLRVMFESGVVKLVAGDPHWRNFSAMDIMYESSPFPTIWGYFDHQLPRAYHVLEILFTFCAELVAPLLAVLGGRRGRWIALAIWTIFQLGIQLTNNFGWLNTASIGLGLLLLDDQMIATAAAKLRLARWTRWLASPSSSVLAPKRAWPGVAGAAVLWMHFSLSLFYLAKACGARVYDISPFINAPVNALNAFGSVNEYHLYARLAPVRYQVEFVGSNDDGRTWHSYGYRYMPQAEDRICPFIAPRFVRFDASLQIASLAPEGKSRIFNITASRLLDPTPQVLSLFRDNPFPDRPPTIIRMRRYRFKFTDLATYHRTGRFWEKEPAGDYLPPLHRDALGQVAAFDSSAADTEFQRGNSAAAMALLKQQYQQGYLAAGFRLADIYLRGPGIESAPAKAFALFTDLAREGEVGAEYNLGICYEHGVGVAEDIPRAAHWYHLAGDHGYLLGYFSFGALGASDRLQPRDDVEALSSLFKAAEPAAADDPAARYIRDNQPGLVKLLEQRMTFAEIAAARNRAKP